MRNLKFIRLVKLVFALALMVIISSSCKKDDEINPDYVGTWIAVESIPTASGYTEIRDIVTISEIGISSLNAITGLPTGTIIGYKEGSVEFESILSQTEQSQTFESEYSISGSELTLKTDNNYDGDYLDEDEVTVYTKQ